MDNQKPKSKYRLSLHNTGQNAKTNPQNMHYRVNMKHAIKGSS
jgi:hypothetical protein